MRSFRALVGGLLGWRLVRIPSTFPIVGWSPNQRLSHWHSWKHCSGNWMVWADLGIFEDNRWVGVVVLVFQECCPLKCDIDTRLRWDFPFSTIESWVSFCCWWSLVKPNWDSNDVVLFSIRRAAWWIEWRIKGRTIWKRLQNTCV